MGAAHHMRFPSDFCTFVLQPYSSWSCSPAELHYASDCGAKVQNWLESGKCKEGKNTLQFELLTTYLSKIPCKMSYTPKKTGTGGDCDNFNSENAWRFTFFCLTLHLNHLRQNKQLCRVTPSSACTALTIRRFTT